MIISSPVKFLFTTWITLLSLASCVIARVSEGETKMEIKLKSGAFENNHAIPIKFTCDGADVSPPLSWDAAPEGSLSLALIVEDPDAPNGPWTHWLLYNIPPQLSGLPEGIKHSVVVPGIGSQGTNDSRKTGYNGPCPPRGMTHHYLFKLYALDILLELEAGAKKPDVEKALQGHILAQGQIIGLYSR